jgi:hypothetical protein
MLPHTRLVPPDENAQPPAKAIKTNNGGRQPVVAKESSTTTTTANIKKESKKNPFDTKFELLKQFKEQFGEYHVYQSRCQGKFKGLDDWVRKQRNRILDYQKDPSKVSNYDTMLVQRMLQLDDFPLYHAREKGVQMKRRQSNSPKWEARFQQLVDYKAKYGTVKMTKRTEGYDEPLFRWTCYQKEQLLNHLKDPNATTLTPENVRRLRDLGLTPKGQPSCSWIPLDLQQACLAKVQQQRNQRSSAMEDTPGRGTAAAATTEAAAAAAADEMIDDYTAQEHNEPRMEAASNHRPPLTTPTETAASLSNNQESAEPSSTEQQASSEDNDHSHETSDSNRSNEFAERDSLEQALQETINPGDGNQNEKTPICHGTRLGSIQGGRSKEWGP